MCGIDTLYEGWRNGDGTATVSAGGYEYRDVATALFDWGSAGKGSHYFARFLLVHSGVSWPAAVRHAPAFVRARVSKWGAEWAITALEILAWVEGQ